MQPDFLSLDEIVRIHVDQIGRYGGTGGVRDAGLLQSAVAAPRACFEGKLLHRDVFEMAAAYLFHIAKSHPFMDGNKRTGLAAAIVFLDLNGIRLKADERALVNLVVAVASGKASKETVAEFFRSHAE